MSQPDFDALVVGSALPTLVEGPITRHTLGRYAGASGDYNPLHIDQDYARDQAGMPDVFAHGMLSAAYLTRVLTRWVDPTAIRCLSVRFVAMTQVGDEVHCRAVVADKFLEGGTPCVRLDLFVHSQVGEPRLTGSAVVAMSGPLCARPSTLSSMHEGRT